MFLTIVWLLVAIAGSLATYFGCGMMNTWWLFFVPILLVPAYYLAQNGLWIVSLWVGSLFIDKKKIAEKPNRAVMWIATETTYTTLHLLGGFVKVTGREKLPKDGPVIFVSNHLSDFDQFAIIGSFGHYPMIWISKPENFDFPIAGPWLAKAGYLPIDRENPFSGVRTIRKAAEIAKAGYASIGVAPEGTRSKDHQLHEFHAGSFRVATLSGRPLVVLCLQNTCDISHNLFRRFTHIKLDVLKVYPFSEIKDRNTVELSDEVHALIAEHLEKSQGKEEKK